MEYYKIWIKINIRSFPSSIEASSLGLSLVASNSSIVHVLDDLKRTAVLPSFVFPRSFGAFVDHPRVCRWQCRSIGGMVNHIPNRWRHWQK